MPGECPTHNPADPEPMDEPFIQPLDGHHPACELFEGGERGRCSRLCTASTGAEDEG